MSLDRLVATAEAKRLLRDVLDRDRAVGRAHRSYDAVHDLEIAGPDLELLRGGLEQLLARRLGRSLHGLSDRVCDLRAAAGARVGPGRRVGCDHAHLLGRQAEGGGGDGREARVHARHVHRRGDDGHRSVGVHAADRCRRLVAAWPVAGRDSDPFALGERVSRSPELVRGRRLQDLDRSEGRHRPRHAAVALDAGVLQAQLDRVDAELGGQLVEQRLDGEGGGRSSRPAIGAEREPVRLHAVAADVPSVPAVRAGHEQ